MLIVVTSHLCRIAKTTFMEYESPKYMYLVQLMLFATCYMLLGKDELKK